MFHKLKSEVLSHTSKSKARIEDLSNKLDSTDNYLARYLPLNTFCMIIEACKVCQIDFNRNKKLKETIENYEQFKMKALYAGVLFDDGRAPADFQKDHLEVERKEINELLNKDIRLSSRNLRVS